MNDRTHRCATCRWWADRRASDLVAVPDGWRECALTTSESDEPRHPGTRAFAVDHERYEAELLTAPDFGCVQWEGAS